MISEWQNPVMDAITEMTSDAMMQVISTSQADSMTEHMKA